MSIIYTITSKLLDLPLENARVLLRADLNVPLDQTAILSDFRLHALQPTLDLLIKKKACIFLVTHIGRPHNHDSLLSTKRLLPWFKQQNYAVTHVQSIDEAAKFFAPCHIVLLENIRFWSEEKTGGTTLAHKLHAVTDFFVQDAFGALHRTDTTITFLPTLYPESNRTIGLLIERELQALNTILLKPTSPVLAIIGGAKIATKLPLINHLLTQADTIALLPPLSLAFAHACNLSVGSSFIDTTHTTTVTSTLNNARKNNKQILLPLDYIASKNGWQGPYTTVKASELELDHMCITIGPQTQSLIQQHIARANTIIFNGPSGDLIYPKTCVAIQELFKTFCQSSAYKLVAGADSIAVLEYFKLQHCVTYCSSGGGASIAYLSGQALAGLKPFCT